MSFVPALTSFAATGTTTAWVPIVARCSASPSSLSSSSAMIRRPSDRRTFFSSSDSALKKCSAARGGAGRSTGGTEGLIKLFRLGVPSRYWNVSLCAVSDVLKRGSIVRELTRTATMTFVHPRACPLSGIDVHEASKTFRSESINRACDCGWENALRGMSGRARNRDRCSRIERVRSGAGSRGAACNNEVTICQHTLIIIALFVG